MGRIYILIILIFLFLSTSVRVVFAGSSYVLPYPSTMPGGLYYKLHLVFEEIQKYWYFGDFSQFDYNLKESDKYLVEAKTLFEYKQYLLGASALKKSDKYFVNIKGTLEQALKNGKNVQEREKILLEAALKHVETLVKIKEDTPENFEWRPEKGIPTSIPLGTIISKSKQLRLNSL